MIKHPIKMNYLSKVTINKEIVTRPSNKKSGEGDIFYF